MQLFLNSISAMERKWIVCYNLLHLKRYSVMYNVISDIKAHWYALFNTMKFTFNFCNAIETNCALMFIINNHIGRKCLSNILHLERCNVMFDVISEIMAYWYAICNTNIFSFNFCNAIKTNWRIVHWCLSWVIFMEENSLLILFTMNYLVLC